MNKQNPKSNMAAHIPIDRRQAMTMSQDLPDRMQGAVLFADISGFTPLTEMLIKTLGPRRGAEVLTRQLNAVYGALIAEVHRYRGSVIGFSGDAITCWFDSDDGRRAVASALAMQRVIGRFAEVEVGPGRTVSLTLKAAATTGLARRFLVGDPQIQFIDVAAGATLDRMAEAEKLARTGDVVIDSQTASHLGDRVTISAWRENAVADRRFAVVEKLIVPVETAPWSMPSASALTEEQVRPWLLPPVYEQLRAGQDRFLAELRPAVALFLKFGGLDYDRDDAAGEKLDAYIRRVQNVLAPYEGYLIQLTTGDKGSYLYATFGAPLAHDDDPDRAVAAALEFQSLPSAPDVIGIPFAPTDVQIGISQGRMRTGPYGGPTRRTYGVLGDEVNVAARLMGKAEPGRILVSKRIADAAGRYEFRPLGKAMLKGRQSPLPVYAPLGKRSPSSPRLATAFTAPLIGRDDELAQAARIMDSVRAGAGRILRLRGEAGVGKSRLAAELIERATNRGFRVTMGSCESTGQTIAYTPWRQIFQALFGLMDQPIGEQIAQVKAAVSDLNPDWLLRAPLLGDLLGLPIPDSEITAAFDPQLRQESLFALVVAIMEALALRQPLLLLIEDAHWMDEVSLGLTMALAQSLAHTPILLILVHRPADDGARPLLPDLGRLPSYRCIELHELSSPEVAALMMERLNGAPSPLALGLIQAVAQGNPFFVEELVTALRESGDLQPGDDDGWVLSEPLFEKLRVANCLTQEEEAWELAESAPLSVADLGIPDTVHGTVLARLDRLPEPHKLTMKVAGVIGRAFELDLLAGAHPTHPDRRALSMQMDMLQARSFIRSDAPPEVAHSPQQQTYVFRHNITQEVVYQTLLEDQQRALHRAVGEVLEQAQPQAVERLAYHYSRSGMREKALLYLDRAAQKAQAEYANETAINYYDQALAIETHWERYRGKVEALHILGRREDERSTLTALEDTPEAPAFDAAYLWGRYYEAIGDYPNARANIEQALSACSIPEDLPHKTRCLVKLGLIARKRGHYDRAKERYTQALELLHSADRARSEPASTSAHLAALNGLGTIHRQQGEYDEARGCYERSLALGRAEENRIEEAKALSNLGVTAFYQRDFDKAQTFHRRALEIRRAIGDRAGVGISLGNLALTVRDAGDYDQAQAYLSEALTIQQTIGNRYDEANVWNDLGVIYLLAGDLPEARGCFEKSLQLSQEIGDEAGEAYFLGNLGLVVREQGDLEEARRLLSHGLELAREQKDQLLASLFLSHLGRVNLLDEREDRAIAQAHEALTIRREHDLELWTTADLATLAAAHLASGDENAALSYARQALKILDDCGGEGPEFPHHDYFMCHRVLSAVGQEEAARDALQSAYELTMAQAERIKDPSLRRSFLEQVRTNRQIVRAYAASQRGSDKASE
jgi:class 3 adenylate cyclase/tetratricopeptide (TPR) repeat protein